MNLANVRDGIKTQLATITGLRAHDVWPDQINTPAALVKPTGWTYDLSMGSSRGIDHAVFDIVVLAASAQNGLARGQDALDQYLASSGATSILAAIKADKTLSGYAQTCALSGGTDYGTLEVNDIDYVGARLTLEVWG